MKTLQLEITYACNERCRHCYHAKNGPENYIGNIPLLDKMLKEFGELGFMFITITGGEPLLHPDFEKICRTAQKNRYAISIKTNGTLINDKTGCFFQELKPLDVQISLYSADQAEHDLVTGIEGSFTATMEGIEKLKKGGVKVSVMTPVIKGIKKWMDLFDSMKKIAVPWSCSPYIYSSFDEREEVEKCKNDFKDHLRFIEFAYTHGQNLIDPDNLCFKECEGGRNTVCVGPDYFVRACISFPEKAGKYEEVHAVELLTKARSQLGKRFSALECHDCEFLKFCSPCPARNKILNNRSLCEKTKRDYAAAYLQFLKNLR